jgi:pentatricopeptide repeat protein
MLDDERRESKEGRHYQNQNLLKEYNDKAYERKSQHSAMGESKVGAWTSAINACGKAGRIDTALRLFFVSMPRFGVQPNIVTCGCLLDCLLRHGESRTADTIDVLRYMKKNDIPPSQVMYTSLMTYASRLADTEQIANESISLMSTRTSHDSNEKEEGNAKAVNVYSELLSSLLERKPDAMKNPEGAENENLFQVTLLFQDMKSSGVIPDLACYNVLLRSCARTGDIGRAMEVLSEMTDEDRDDIEPNDRTWRELLKCASTARRSDMVLRVWKMAIEHTGKQEKSKEKLNGQSSEKALTIRSTRTLSMKTLRAFLTALLRCAWNMRKSDRLTSSELYKLMIKCYHASLSRSSYMGMDVVEAAAFEHPHIAASFLQAVVTLESFVVEDNGNSINDESIQLRNLAKLMMKSDALSSPSTAEITGKNPHYRNAILIAKSWI